MLTNRPEFHWFDSAALHLGATPSRSTTPTRPSRSAIRWRTPGRASSSPRRPSSSASRPWRAWTTWWWSTPTTPTRRSPWPTWRPRATRSSTSRPPGGRWSPSDTLTLIYTSGTTGPPKGVQLTHANLIAAVNGFDQVIAFPADGRVVSWLPMAHIAERACSHYLPMMLGFTTTSCPDPRQVVAYLPEVRPTWFFAVPRIWEKLKAAMEAGIAAEPDDAKRQATQWALEVGLQEGQSRAGRRGGSRGARRRARQGGRAGAVEDPHARWGWTRSSRSTWARRPPRAR